VIASKIASLGRSRMVGSVGLLFATLLGTASGCASHVDGNLHLLSADKKHDFSQTFTQAYLTRTETGDVDVLLEQDGLTVGRHDDPDKPLAPDACLTPRQFVHVRVFWKPLSQRADRPAATNASIDWYLFGDGPNEGSLLEYSGPALVSMDDSADVSLVTIRNAWMKVVSQRGDMVDPLGPSEVKGSVHAIVDQDRFNTLMSELKTATGATAPEVTAVPTLPPHAGVDP
jgi:hypothetical protein